jgi:LuxR family maltose regulon positive regulatory protein
MFGFFAPHLTLVKAWLAQDTPASRRQAAQMVSQVRAFCESTHSTRFLIETLALQAMLYDVEGDEAAALAALEQAIAYAAPGGFVRLFVDLGPSVARPLARLRWKGTAPAYIGRLLSAFPASGGAEEVIDRRGSAVQDWVEPLTSRESEVLALLGQHLSNKEIAAELVISSATVKSHTLNIYRKFDVRKRQEAVARAMELGIL